jgi:hypothetical protein
MATISRIKLSGSTDGRGIAVAANSSAGTTIHTGPAVAADYEEIWLWASNFNTSAETLVLEWGGTTQAGDHFVTVIEPNQTVLVSPGWVLKGNAGTALIVKAFSTTANKVNLVGYVNLIDAA